MTTKEDQAKQVVPNIFLNGWGQTTLSIWQVMTRIKSSHNPSLAANEVNCFEPSDRDQPASRISRHPFMGPLLQSGFEGILKAVLSKVKVTD